MTADVKPNPDSKRHFTGNPFDRIVLTVRDSTGATVYQGLPAFIPKHAGKYTYDVEARELGGRGNGASVKDGKFEAKECAPKKNRRHTGSKRPAEQPPVINNITNIYYIGDWGGRREGIPGRKSPEARLSFGNNFVDEHADERELGSSMTVDMASHGPNYLADADLYWDGTNLIAIRKTHLHAGYERLSGTGSIQGSQESYSVAVKGDRFDLGIERVLGMFALAAYGSHQVTTSTLTGQERPGRQTAMEGSALAGLRLYGDQGMQRYGFIVGGPSWGLEEQPDGHTNFRGWEARGGVRHVAGPHGIGIEAGYRKVRGTSQQNNGVPGVAITDERFFVDLAWSFDIFSLDGARGGLTIGAGLSNEKRPTIMVGSGGEVQETIDGKYARAAIQFHFGGLGNDTQSCNRRGGRR